jgi:hypothetical protein
VRVPPTKSPTPSYVCCWLSKKVDRRRRPTAAEAEQACSQKENGAAVTLVLELGLRSFSRSASRQPCSHRTTTGIRPISRASLAFSCGSSPSSTFSPLSHWTPDRFARFHYKEVESLESRRNWTQSPIHTLPTSEINIPINAPKKSIKSLRRTPRRSTIDDAIPRARRNTDKLDPAHYFEQASLPPMIPDFLVSSSL